MPDDADTVLELLAEASAWTESIGYTNWPARFPTKIVTRGITKGELFVVDATGGVFATVALLWSDPMIWGERADDAGYVHRLVVRRDRAGTGLGAEIIDWAAGQVSAAGRDRLRLDASADNLPLCSYYERLGFQHRGSATGELDQPDGTVRRWTQRLYERECGGT
jgi:GNAT superfamily N-acetyltransferase